MVLPQATDYQTADEWLTALEEAGRSVGATRMDDLGLGRLVAESKVAAFWDAIVDAGKIAPPEEGATIEEQLRASYTVQTTSSH